MKNLYKLFFSVAVAAFGLCVTPANAVASEQGNISFQIDRLEQRGDSLYVVMSFTSRGRNVASCKSADFTLVLTSPSQSQRLPGVSFKGRNDFKTYRRRMALMNAREKAVYDQSAPYEVIADYKRGEKRVDYKLTLPYENWMASAQLILERDDCGCGNSRTTDVRMLTEKVDLENIVIESYTIVPSLAYVQPEPEPVKLRKTTARAYLDFAVGQSVLLPEFGCNPQELAKIRAMIDDVKGDKDVTVRQIAITGYASPEGPLALNKQLSERRALTIENYLMKQYDFPQSLFKVDFGGEDWDGLVKLVAASDMEYKQQILDIIGQVGILNGRESKLMALGGGVSWRYMLREMFPPLRRVDIVARFEVADFDPQEAEEVVRIRLQNLSQLEIYTLAQTYRTDSEEFNELFEIAVRMFPDDATANINAAVAALGRNDYASADRYLKNVLPAARTPEYDNAMGVLVMLRDADYDKARSYLTAAQQAGIAEAGKNLEEIDRKRENIARIQEAEHSSIRRNQAP